MKTNSDSKDLKIKGVIEIIENGKTIFKDNNEILVNNALEIILSSLGTQQNVGIDRLRVTGITGVIEKPILDSTLIMSENSITFTTTLAESDYNGYINKLELVNSTSGKVFSQKQNLNVFKDNSNKLRVDWTITINLTT